MGLVDTAVTSKACKWNDMSRKKVDPAPLSQIDFTRPKLSQTVRTPKILQQEQEIEPVDLADLESLKEIFPSAAVLTSMDVSDGATDTASECEDELDGVPEPLTAMYDPTAKALAPEDLQQRCQKAFDAS